MTKAHNHQHAHQHPTHRRRPAPHKDWRVWTAVALMLGAMLMYVMSVDESIVPEGPAQPALDDVDAE